jgi:hypothetical protein
LASSRVSSNGPDWTDVAAAILAVEDFHRVSIVMEVMLPRPGRKGLLEVKAKATKLLGQNGEARPSVSRSVLISGGDPTMVAATTFRLVYDLDRDCGAMWAQMDLFESV